jgi:transposase InsO family protein
LLASSCSTKPLARNEQSASFVWSLQAWEPAYEDSAQLKQAALLEAGASHVIVTDEQDLADEVIRVTEGKGARRLNRLPDTIEWLPDNGSCYTAADTRRFARNIGFRPLRTPIESPQSNGMAEAFVRTFKRDYVAFNPKPDAATVIRSLPAWFEHYNSLHPHRSLGYRSPREFIDLKPNSTGEVPLSGN